MADLVLLHGTVLTQDPARPLAEAIAVEAGRIAAVGSNDEIAHLARAATRRIDLGGRTVVPGFHDAHCHLWKIGDLLTRTVDLREARSLDEMAEALRRAASRLAPGAWLVARGWNELRLREGRAPDRAQLDAIAPDRPAFLVRTCAHVAVANTRALRAAGITRDTGAPAGGVIDRDTRGEPTGRLEETALGLVHAKVPEPSAAEYAAMIEAASRHQLALGITSTTDAGVVPALLAVYRDRDAGGGLLQRVNVMATRLGDAGRILPFPDRHVSGHLRIDTVKLWADGGLSGATAAIGGDYRHAPGRGILRLGAAAIEALAREIHAAGLRVAIHAIGDAAIDHVLRGLEAAGPGSHAPRLEHFGLPTDDHIRRAARLKAIVAPQPIFLRALGANFRRYLPDRLLSRAYPLRAMLEGGLAVALSSDAPVVEEDAPLAGMQAAILRRTEAGDAIAPEQAISAAEALHAYTAAGARASGDDATRGRVRAGQWADLAILGANPLEVEPEALGEIPVDRTLVAGRTVFER